MYPLKILGRCGITPAVQQRKTPRLANREAACPGVGETNTRTTQLLSIILYLLSILLYLLSILLYLLSILLYFQMSWFTLVDSPLFFQLSWIELHLLADGAEVGVEAALEPQKQLHVVVCHRLEGHVDGGHVERDGLQKVGMQGGGGTADGTKNAKQKHKKTNISTVVQRCCFRHILRKHTWARTSYLIDTQKIESCGQTARRQCTQHRTNQLYALGKPKPSTLPFRMCRLKI